MISPYFTILSARMGGVLNRIGLPLKRYHPFRTMGETPSTTTIQLLGGTPIFRAGNLHSDHHFPWVFARSGDLFEKAADLFEGNVKDDDFGKVVSISGSSGLSEVSQRCLVLMGQKKGSV